MENVAPPEPVLMHVEVTNGLPDPIEDMCNGIPVVFPPGVPVTVSPLVAAHCFGYPNELQAMAMHMAKRWGWATPDNLVWTAHKKPKYVELAEKITFTPVFYDLVRRKPDDPIPAIVEDDERPPPAPVAADTTVVGKKSRNYKDATREKRAKEKAKKGSRGGRTPHINVAEA